MIIVILLSVLRTFEMMRIFEDYSPIIAMLMGVFMALRAFLFFFFIIIAFFTLFFEILSVKNEMVKGSKFSSHFMATLFLSLGDPGMIENTNSLNKDDSFLFWFSWLIVVAMTSIIMLNFVIAEATFVYD
jgi:hypothetical protein